MSSKRHSMPVGPRPLQLASGPASDGLPSAPLSAVSSFSPGPSTPTTPNGGPRRQSSITYNPSTRPPRSAGHRSSIVRSNSVGGSLDRPSNTGPERSPVTLAEKHADLLHFIAQKESKCLELRSQLAVHEAELLQLKRKWERIVSRGFTSPHNASLAASTSTSTISASSLENSPNPTSANGGAVLDGIREGVQGMGRFIAALSPTTPYSSSFDSVLPRGTHSKNSSMSTMATTMSGSTSKSTRLSQSSASSLGEETSSAPCTPSDENDDPDAQVLMVHDTGATPTMSPNPAFNARRQQQLRERERLREVGLGDSSAEAEEDFFFASEQAAMGTPPPTARPLAKRPASTSAIPGMALVDSVAPVSAWVGTVGKKWEELQRAPSFAKNQKRASLLFSDIAHALQVGPPPSQSPSPSHSRSPIPSPMASSTSLLDDDDEMGGGIMMPDAPALKPAPAPALKLAAARKQQQQQPQAQSPLSLSKSKVPLKPKPPQQQQQTQTLDDDGEEWNW